MADISKVFVELDTKLLKFKEEWGAEFKRRVAEKTPVATGALQRGWGFQRRATSIEIYNTMDYATFVEYGTPKMAPRGMMRATALEHDQISEVAAQKAGLK